MPSLHNVTPATPDPAEKEPDEVLPGLGAPTELPAADQPPKTPPKQDPPKGVIAKIFSSLGNFWRGRSPKGSNVDVSQGAQSQGKYTLTLKRLLNGIHYALQRNGNVEDLSTRIVQLQAQTPQIKGLLDQPQVQSQAQPDHPEDLENMRDCMHVLSGILCGVGGFYAASVKHLIPSLYSLYIQSQQGGCSSNYKLAFVWYVCSFSVLARIGALFQKNHSELRVTLVDERNVGTTLFATISASFAFYLADQLLSYGEVRSLVFQYFFFSAISTVWGLIDCKASASVMNLLLRFLAPLVSFAGKVEGLL
jgi:hypothetical protein